MLSMSLECDSLYECYTVKMMKTRERIKKAFIMKSQDSKMLLMRFLKWQNVSIISSDIAVNTNADKKWGSSFKRVQLKFR